MRARSKIQKNACQVPNDDEPDGEKPPVGDAQQLEAPEEPDDPSDLDDADFENPEDDRWDVFILDDDDNDPLPEYGDFWFPD